MKKPTSYSLYLLLTFAACLLAASGSARASTLPWDPLGTGTGSDGSGTWTATSNTWAFNGHDTSWGTTYVNIASLGDGGTAGTITLGSSINLLSGAGITFNSGGTGNYLITGPSNYMLAGASNGTATITMNKSGEIDASLGNGGTTTTMVIAGTGTLTLGGTTNNPYLALKVNSGATVILAKTTSGVNAVSGTDIFGTLQLAGTTGDQIYDGNHSIHAYTMIEGGGVFDMNGRSETINGVYVNNGGSGVATLTNTSLSTATLTMEAPNPATQASEGINLSGSTGTNGNNLTISGSGDITITTGAGAVGSSSTLLTNINGANGVIKNGTNTLNLTGPNTYLGPTEINSGKLNVTNTSGSATGSGEVDVNGTSSSVFGTLTGGNSGTLATLGTGSNVGSLKTYTSGAGSISGQVVVNQFAHLDPGVNGVGSLTTSALTLNSGAVLDYEFSGTANDLTYVTGYSGLTINGGTFNLYKAGTTTAFDTPGVYNLLSYYASPDNGSVSNLSVGDMQAGFTYNFFDDTNDGLVQLDIGTSVPEPSTWALVLGGMATLLILVHKRRKLT